MLAAKSQLSRLVKAALAGEELIIASHGKAQVKLVPCASAAGLKRRPPGGDRGRCALLGRYGAITWGLGSGRCFLQGGLCRQLLQRGDGDHALGREHALSSCQCSSCSSSTAPTRRVIEASFGKIPTTRVRRLTSSLRRSSRLVLHTFFQWGCGKWRKARTSSLASSISSVALGKRSASELAKSSQRLAILLASSWANTERSAAVTMPWWAFGTRCSRFLASAKPSVQGLAQAAVEVGGIEVNVGVAGLFKGTVLEGLHLHVDVGADAADQGFRDATLNPQGCPQGIDLPGGDAANVGLHHHAIERLINPAAGLEDRGQEAAVAQFGDLQVDVARLGGEAARPVTVAVAEPIAGAYDLRPTSSTWRSAPMKAATSSSIRSSRPCRTISGISSPALRRLSGKKSALGAALSTP